jgi:hypothetical protein
MDRLEEQLKQALARADAPEGFAARVAAAARPRPFWRSPALAAGLMLLAVGGGAAWRHHQGEVAKEQVMAAMRITAGTLNHIQQHVREVHP